MLKGFGPIPLKEQKYHSMYINLVGMSVLGGPLGPKTEGQFFMQCDHIFKFSTKSGPFLSNYTFLVF